jgi:hypothetical protein
MEQNKCKRQSVVYEELPKKIYKESEQKSEIEMKSRKSGVKKFISLPVYVQNL